MFIDSGVPRTAALGTAVGGGINGYFFHPNKVFQEVLDGLDQEDDVKIELSRDEVQLG